MIYGQIQAKYDITVRTTGSRYLASTDLESQVLTEYAGQDGNDRHCTLLERSEALERYSFIEPDYCRGALLFPDDLAVDPRLMLRRLIPYLEVTRRVTYVPGTLITSLEASGDRCRAVDARQARRGFACLRLHGRRIPHVRRMIRLPDWRQSACWNGYFLAPRAPTDTHATIEGQIHLVAPIGGRGITIGPGYARRSIERVPH